jgi:hypothetical protein
MKEMLFLTKIVFILAASLGAFLVIGKPEQNISPSSTTTTYSLKQNPVLTVKARDITNPAIHQGVPFILQAPLGNWDNPIFQNACEEASMLMAMAWVENQSVSPQDAYWKILDIARFENDTLGFNADTSIFDVEKIFQNFFRYSNIRVKEKVILDDLTFELRKGNIIIVPVDARLLKNPHYTPPGPIAHMLVVTGYDPGTQEFITNDPGTSFGENYRYKETVFFNALWSYPSSPTALSAPSSANKKTAILVVEPK